MPQTLFADADRDAVLARIRALSPGARPRWGRMNAEQMLAHAAECLRMATGELPVKPIGGRLLRTTLAKWLLIRVLPFPRGVPTAPELVPAATGAFEAEKARLADLVCRLAAGPRTGPGPEHPAFGVLTREEWAEVQHKHLDHHLRQFGG